MGIGGYDLGLDLEWDEAVITLKLSFGSARKEPLPQLNGIPSLDCL